MSAIMPEFYNSAGLNSSTKAVCQELQGVGSHGRATPAGVMCWWPSTFAHKVNKYSEERVHVYGETEMC